MRKRAKKARWMLEKQEQTEARSAISRVWWRGGWKQFLESDQGRKRDRKPDVSVCQVAGEDRTGRTERSDSSDNLWKGLSWTLRFEK